MPYFKDTSNELHFIEDEKFYNLLPAGCVAITDAEAVSIQLAPPTADQLHTQLVADAKTALDSTDLVCLRCYKVAVTFPPEWQTYTASLRAIVNGSDTTSTTLPTRPAYPTGT